MTATTALRSEHDHILAMIACLVSACKAAENDDRLDSDTFRAGLDFIQNYADALHHAKEEGLLFPALEAAGMPRRGGPIAVMLDEHELGRTYVRQIGKNLEAATNGDNSALQLVLRFTLAYAESVDPAHPKRKQHTVQHGRPNPVTGRASTSATGIQNRNSSQCEREVWRVLRGNCCEVM